jgi:hypothetical protein
MLSFHLGLGLLSSLLPSGFQIKILCSSFSSPMRATCHLLNGCIDTVPFAFSELGLYCAVFETSLGVRHTLSRRPYRRKTRVFKKNCAMTMLVPIAH